MANNNSHPEVKFDPKRFTLLLPVSVSDSVLRRTEAVATEYDLQQKTEFHLTVVGFAVGAKLRKIVNRLSRQDQATAERLFLACAQEFDWQYEVSERFWWLEREYQFTNRPDESRQSIIVEVSCPAVQQFSKLVADVFDVSISEPFPHITLYARSSNPKTSLVGIGVTSRSEFAGLSPQQLQV